MLRQLFQLATLALVGLGVTQPQNVWAAPVNTGTFYRFPVFNARANYTDFEVVIGSTANYTNIGFLDDTYLSINNGPRMSPSVANNGTQVVTLSWFPRINNGDLVTGLITGTAAVATVVLYKYNLTDPTPVPGLGWQVTSSGSVYLFNSSDSSVHFANLSFNLSYTSMLSTEDAVNFITSSQTGMLGNITSGDVAAGGSLLVATFSPSVSIVAKFDTSFDDTSFSPITSHDGLFMGVSVPEPPSLFLLLIGLGGSIGYGLQRRGTSRSMAAAGQ
jgi:PEP-CTERM motif